MAVVTPDPALVLIVDDDDAVRDNAALAVEQRGFRVITVPDGESALRVAGEQRPGIVVADVRLPGLSGLTLLERLRETTPDTAVMLMTAFGTVEDAIDAFRRGAEQYLLKPLNLDQLVLFVERARDQVALRLEARRWRAAPDGTASVGRLVGNSRAMTAIYELIRQVAPSDASVLIEGESGTGKELVADAIHRLSPRAAHPFIRMNCAVFSESLLESELFGHERGAFTGAVRARPGRFEAADGGTVFLDDVVVTPPSVQVKLLRFLQEREFERVGSNRTVRVDVRIVAATNQPLDGAVEEGKFREDLYYRLNVVPVRLPPLRERADDIPMLVDHFLRKFNEKNHKDVKGAEPTAMDRIMRYPWPGNVRELENWTERAVVLARSDVLTARDLPPFPNESAVRRGLSSTTLRAARPLHVVEREAILDALRAAGGSVKTAATTLHMSVRTLQHKLKEYREQGFWKGE